ncbi:nucleoside diphosphate kinase 3 isoform X1 [Octopus vulgaris]|uniref:Nucleoside diphosphate kinase 3 isoform X1 n=2 Tax=Octopus TaxID=6643 RepID=A0AA36BY22_OCTVU|nr:nucleoside diphosphate kinase [Octopus sinensis]CAI9741837.1 nucleoside diphosphate kinase 3 isoform X1 [Octopus vulgaris]
MLSTLLSVFANMFSVIGGQVPERSFVAVKPDGVQRALCGPILQRFEKKGFKLVACKFIYPTKELLEAHYAEHKGKSFFDKLVAYMSSGPVFAMVLEGEGVVQMCRQMIGATKPQESMLRTIRGDYAIEMGRNIVHGSDSVTSANHEISLWFSSDELISWESATEHLRYE